ncbi:hypothetical protein [Bradyrhizobium sp. URHD0069]|uniref:hypothetical protein n=1 Tax=Bradyrhizobium sp. URHD0069 TaxID=1380355 RepID=UPI000497038B|nr:hypothetical protein [Bradyrhizobium sp. URHD0069]
MSETHTVFDPFLAKKVEVSSRLVDRLRGRYASGPTMPNGEPEFGWREFQTPPIQHEAAAEIERLRACLTAALGDHVVVPKAALAWLHGEGPDADGKWFGEGELAAAPLAGKYPRRYWWRSKFRAMIESPNPSAGASER